MKCNDYRSGYCWKLVHESKHMDLMRICICYGQKECCDFKKYSDFGKEKKK